MCAFSVSIVDRWKRKRVQLFLNLSFAAHTACTNSCAALGWGAGLGSAAVCARSQTPRGTCSGAVNGVTALNWCQNNFGAGARLCTASELLSGETKQTGCNYDSQMIWSSTFCGSGSLLQVMGDPAKGTGECVV